MSDRSEAVKRWRERTKHRLVEAMGSACVCCGYKKSEWALEPHHLEPTQKEFSLGGARANIVSWARIASEAKKCVLLCSNCHKEVHQGITAVPQGARSFDHSYDDYKTLENCSEDLMDNCPICGMRKPKKLITCSLTCARHRKGTIDWTKIDLGVKLQTMSIQEVADNVGVSFEAVRKRMKKLGIMKLAIGIAACTPVSGTGEPGSTSGSPTIS